MASILKQWKVADGTWLARAQTGRMDKRRAAGVEFGPNCREQSSRNGICLPGVEAGQEGAR